MDIDKFLDMYVSRVAHDDARKRLEELLDKRVDEAESAEVFSPKTGEILDIGEDGDMGFYVVTGDMRKALSEAKKYMVDSCGMDMDYIKDTLDRAEKMKLHLYTKPWETGIYSDWHWFADHSNHPKARWAVKFKF